MDEVALIVRSWREILSRLSWPRRVTAQFWGNATEAVFSVSLMAAGLVVLTWCTASQFLGDADWNLGALLQRGLGVALSGALVLIGGVRLIRVLYLSSSSPEQRNQFFQRAWESDYLRAFELTSTELPAVPRLALGRIVPGQRLRYRLVGVALSRGRWLGLAAFALGMLGVCTVLMAVIWDQWDGLARERWLLTLGVLGVLVAVTGLLLWKTGRDLVEQIHLGPTWVELSQHPLLPGSPCQIFFQQVGEIRLDKLQLVLECLEQATYQQGTNVVTHRQTVYEQTLWEQQKVQLSANEPREQLEFEVPAAAMHSFSSANNQILWRIIAKGVKQGCREFRREFPILVLPMSAGRSSTAGSMPGTDGPPRGPGEAGLAAGRVV